jgi:phosphatidylglycerophosphatase A
MKDDNNIIIKKLKERGVTIKDIAELVIFLQKNYHEITYEQCEKEILKVISKKEAIHAILVGIALDEMAERKMLDQEINDIILEDKSLFGLDEVLALSIVNMHGSIALTNFGYLDKIKPTIIGKVNHDKNSCNTFLDDIIAAIAASTASRIAHSYKE